MSTYNTTLTISEIKAVHITRLCMAIFSFLGSAFILFSLWRFNRLKFISGRLLLYLSLVAFFEALTTIMTIGYNYGEQQLEDTPFCFLLGLSLQFFQLSEFCWLAVIAINLFMVLVLAKHTSTTTTELVYHAVVWPFVLLCALIPLSGDNYGPAGFWCWMKNNTQYRWGTFYGPLFAILALVSLLYSVICCKVCQNFEGETDANIQKQTRKLLRKLSLYPVVFLACYSVPFVNRLYTTITGTDKFGLVLVAGFTAASLGWVNALVYGCDSTTRNNWKNMLLNEPERIGTDDQLSSDSEGVNFANYP